VDSNYSKEFVFHAKLVKQLLVMETVDLLDSIPQDQLVLLVNQQLQLVIPLVDHKDSTLMETLVSDVLLELSPVPQQPYINLVILQMDTT